MKRINKKLYAIYLRMQSCDDTGSNDWISAWNELYKLTGNSMDFTCPEYKKAVKEAEKIRKSPLYKALEEE